MTDLPAGTAWAYGSHVYVSLWDTCPVPGGPTYREIAVAEMRADEASQGADTNG